jgi:cytochrome c peroxidase
MSRDDKRYRERAQPLRAGLLVGLAAIMPTMAAGWLDLPDGEPISPVGAPAAASSDADRVVLGERLFHDPRLSHGDRLACASCHGLDRGGDDGLVRAASASGEVLAFNTPTVFNVALNFRFNWRGNFRTLEEHNEAVLLDESLMNTTWDEVLTKLRADPDYSKGFVASYRAPPSRENVLDALAVYQRSLVTPNAAFDRYLNGDAGAITEEQAQGYRLFKDYGCAACHQGVNVGGNLFQRFGIFGDPFSEKTVLSEGDLGRFTVTGRNRDRQVFRVPSLRNVAVTAPYFHDGRTASLGKAVEIMGRNQLGRELRRRDIELIVQFLETLTGEYRGRPLGSGAAGRAR